MISPITVRFDFTVRKILTDFLSEIVSESANSASARGGQKEEPLKTRRSTALPNLPLSPEKNKTRKEHAEGQSGIGDKEKKEKGWNNDCINMQPGSRVIFKEFLRGSNTMVRFFSIPPPPLRSEGKATHTHTHMHTNTHMQTHTQETLQRNLRLVTNMQTCEWEKCQRGFIFWFTL